MHASVLSYIRRTLRLEDVAGKDVLEVGAYNVNGSARDVIGNMSPDTYVGADMRPGPGVNFVCKAEELTRFFTAEFDVVVSTEMLEHVENWRGAVTAMKQVLKPGGILLLTTRSVGFPLHSYPDDYWRFSEQDMVRILADMDDVRTELDTQAAGVFAVCRRPEETPMDIAWPYALEGVQVYAMDTGRLR